MPHLRRATCFALLFGAACAGEISDGAPEAGGARPPVATPSPADEPGVPSPAGAVVPPPFAPDPPAPPASCNAPTPGPAPIRRLVRFEYNNVVRDLVGDTTRPADAFPPEEEAAGFDNDAGSLTATRVLVEQHLAAARQIAARATRDLAALLRCDVASSGESTCVERFIDDFAARAFRRPVKPDERARLLALATLDRETDDLPTRLQSVITAVLQMPQFLYRLEEGRPVQGAQGRFQPTPYEMASRLSFLLWGTMPDDGLFAEAKAGGLSSREQVAAQARRMLRDPRARAVVRRFHAFALDLRGGAELKKDARLFPQYTPELAPLFTQETEGFMDQVIWGDGGGLGALLTAPYTFLNERLARYYGVAGVSGDEHRRTALDPARAAGFLTQGSTMARLAKIDRTDPIARGLFVRSALLCSPPPDPPLDVPEIDPRETPATLSSREVLARHRSDAACAACHQLFDPIGFGFETHDAAGRWRATENGRAVDASGEIVGTDVAGPFVGPVALAKKLAGSASLRRCYIGKWFQFAYGRPEAPADRCSRARLEQAFSAPESSVQDLLLALTQTDAFLFKEGATP